MRAFVLRKRFKHIFKEYLIYIIVAALIGLLMRLFIVEVYKVPSESMLPSLLPGDHIAVLKFPFEPERGDVVVFKRKGESSYFVKRVIGLPKDLVEVKKGRIYINDLPLKLEPVTETSYYAGVEPGDAIYKEYTGGRSHLILKGMTEKDSAGISEKMGTGYFLMGDNRSNSVDSRKWGEIKSDDILGKVVYIWFSVEPQTKKIRWGRIGRVHEVESSDRR
jgi:signal peptidase I